jgi:hypothetical protein
MFCVYNTKNELMLLDSQLKYVISTLTLLWVINLYELYLNFHMDATRSLCLLHMIYMHGTGGCICEMHISLKILHTWHTHIRLTLFRTTKHIWHNFEQNCAQIERINLSSALYVVRSLTIRRLYIIICY